MICPKCGSNVPEGKFCSSCGAILPENTADAAPSSGNTKKVIIIIVSIIAALALLIGGLAATLHFFKKAVSNSVEQIEETVDELDDEIEDDLFEEKEQETPAGNRKDNDLDGDIKTMTRNSLLPAVSDESELAGLVPSVPKYEVEPDLGNIINRDEYEYFQPEFLEKLKKNGFVVSDGAGREFFEHYETNRYLQVPNFVTVDSMMHTYHIYFAYLMRDIEKNHLLQALTDLTEDMLEESYAQYEELEGTKWEDAARRNVAFFSVAAVLLDESARFPADVSDIVEGEYSLIMDASAVVDSPLTGDYEDYSQYKPRGYYEGDEELERYFRAMMWYGRRQFTQEEEDMDRSALLITLALNDGNFDNWDAIYTVTSFFAGASDDLGYYEYMPVIEKVYGKNATVSDIAGDEDAWDDFHALTAKLRAPRINSIPIMDTEDADNVIPGYRFMGQRFTIDATIMQELVYRRVGKFEDKDKRMLPDVLDVPAALGSDMAYSILDKSGATKYANYDRNLKNMRKEFDNDDSSIWNASLYAGWLNTLRPLLDKKGEGYPMFMQSDEWTKKDLETFAGSYTELKHDTVLYSKQVMAEMGGGWEDDKDFRGYVEPEPLVYLRFETLAKNTAKGLDKLGYLSAADEENLEKLADLADKLKVISVKELQDEKLTDDEYELIEIYGGEIEHFWLDAMKAQTGDEYPNADNYPAALVVDVATDPNGSVLEMATGDPAIIYVVVPVEGKLRVAQGTVYSFYQFEVPIEDRMTDSEWRKKMGISFDEEEGYNFDHSDVEHPDWANGYRYVYRYE